MSRLQDSRRAIPLCKQVTYTRGGGGQETYGCSSPRVQQCVNSESLSRPRYTVSHTPWPHGPIFKAWLRYSATGMISIQTTRFRVSFYDIFPTPSFSGRTLFSRCGVPGGMLSCILYAGKYQTTVHHSVTNRQEFERGLPFWTSPAAPARSIFVRLFQAGGGEEKTR